MGEAFYNFIYILKSDKLKLKLLTETNPLLRRTAFQCNRGSLACGCFDSVFVLAEGGARGTEGGPGARGAEGGPGARGAEGGAGALGGAAGCSGALGGAAGCSGALGAGGAGVVLVSDVGFVLGSGRTAGREEEESGLAEVL